MFRLIFIQWFSLSVSDYYVYEAKHVMRFWYVSGEEYMAAAIIIAKHNTAHMWATSGDINICHKIEALYIL